MSQDKNQMCGNGNGAGGVFRSTSRRVKQNKAPQRGLGVEKLERIRLEEQRKNGGVPVPPPTGPATQGTRQGGPVVVVPLPPPPSVPFPSPSIPFPSASLSDFSSSALLSNSNSSSALYSQNSNPTTITTSVATEPAYGWSLGGGVGGGGGGGTQFEPRDLSSGSPLHLDNDSKPNWPPLLLMQWRQHNQQQFSSLANPPLSTSSSSAALNFQLEPPSIQNTYTNYTNYIHPLEDKMVGLKRSWPFSLDNLSDSSYSCNVPPFGRSDETYGNGNPIIREGHSSSPSQNLSWRENSSELLPNKRMKENSNTLDGDFLSLGLSGSSSYPSTTHKFKQPLTFPPPDYQELAKYEVQPFHGGMEHQHYSFFPMGQSALKGEGGGEGVDLTLKL